jgi:hypothetical protein
MHSRLLNSRKANLLNLLNALTLAVPGTFYLDTLLPRCTQNPRARIRLADLLNPVARINQAQHRGNSPTRARMCLLRGDQLVIVDVRGKRPPSLYGPPSVVLGHQAQHHLLVVDLRSLHDSKTRARFQASPDYPPASLCVNPRQLGIKARMKKR